MGRRDNFFELGGHSLLVVTMIERLREAGYKADVKAIFASPTLAALAATVEEDAATVEIPENRIHPVSGHHAGYAAAGEPDGRGDRQDRQQSAGGRATCGMFIR